MDWIVSFEAMQSSFGSCHLMEKAKQRANKKICWLMRACELKSASPARKRRRAASDKNAFMSFKRSLICHAIEHMENNIQFIAFNISTKNRQNY